MSAVDCLRGMMLALLGVGTLPGCSQKPTPKANNMAPGYAAICVPGRVEACACGPGVVGTSTCTPAGLAQERCECPPAPVPGRDTQLPAANTRPMPAGPSSTGLDAGTPTAPNTVTEPPPSSPAPTDSAQPSTEPAPAPPVMVVPADTLEPAPPMTPAAATLERAHNLRITEVALYQPVKIPLARGGQPVIERNAPVILGKDAFLRVFVQPLPGYTPRELEVALTLRSQQAGEETLRIRQHISTESTEEALDTTINFDIPRAGITEDLQWAVTLQELTPSAAAGGPDTDSRYPPSDDTLDALQARYVGPLRIMLVPYRYNADGTGRVPDISEAQLGRYRAYLGAYYPFSELTLELHEPVDYEREVTPFSGWDALLDFTSELRARENPDPKTFYYGLIEPTAHGLLYDDTGLVGLAFIPGPAVNHGRCAVGLGFSGGGSGFILSHELGHALGLPHAPCGNADNPGPFPYQEAGTGTWGFNFSTRSLKAPDQNYDLMSYCTPAFVSDYTYQKMFERIRYLNLQFSGMEAPAPQGFVRVLQQTNGLRVTMGQDRLAVPPGGDQEARQLRLLDENGELIDSARRSYFIPMSEGGAGTWFIPDVGAHSVEFSATERMQL